MKTKLIFTVTLLCVTLFVPLSLFSQNQDFEINGTTLVKYHGNAEKVTIPEGVTVIGSETFAFCYNLTNVTIPPSVTTIEREAFAFCSRLTSITIPSSVVTIGDYAFYDCTSLTSVTIPSSVITIGDYAFNNSEAVINNLRTVTVSRKTTIGKNAFPDTVRITYSD